MMIYLDCLSSLKTVVSNRLLQMHCIHFLILPFLSENWSFILFIARIAGLHYSIQCLQCYKKISYFHVLSNHSVEQLILPEVEG